MRRPGIDKPLLFENWFKHYRAWRLLAVGPIGHAG